MTEKKKLFELITRDKLLGHTETVLIHKYLVARHCFAVGLYAQGILHDLSKFSPTEFLNSVAYYQGGVRSPNNGERDDKGYSESWMHHKGRNRHHYEYWNDYSAAWKEGEDPIVYVQMPRKYVVEMVMDRIAASKTYRKGDYLPSDPLIYFQKGRAAKLMNRQTARELEGMLRILASRGEKELFRFIRDYYLKGYPIPRKPAL